MTEGQAETDLLDPLIVGVGTAGLQRSLLLEKLHSPGKRVDKDCLGQAVACEGAVGIADDTQEPVWHSPAEFVTRPNLDIRKETEVAAIAAEGLCRDHLACQMPASRGSH